MRLGVAVAVVCLGTIGLASADDVRASIKRPVNIPAQALGPALQTLAKDRDFQVVYVSEEVNSLQTHGAVGEFTSEEALKQLLTGTGMTFRYLDENTVTIVRVASSSTAAGGAPAGNASAESTPNDSQKEGKKSSSDEFRVAQVDQGAPASASAVERQDQQTSERIRVKLEEVIVTAQKRDERLQDVPVPVTAISADTLVNADQLRLQEYFANVPGLNFTSGNRGEPFVAIRGITTSPFTNPTVGFTVDDLPVGGSSLPAGGFIAPDIDPSDLARIEVLRGPQGTLYGVSSLGGLIKYVTVDPSTDGVKGRLQAGMSSTYNGAELGYSASGAVNVPLSDTFAVRASAFTHAEPGYVDNVETGERAVNEGKAYGGRLSALWVPSEAFSLKLGALLQDRNTDGSQLVYESPGLGDLQQTYPKGSGWSRTAFQVYSATISAKLGVADLTALTGYNVTSVHDSVDTSPFFGGLATSLFGVTAAPYVEDYYIRKLTQEVRVSAPLGERLQILVGGFYTHEKFSYLQGIVAVDPASGRQAGTIANLSDPGTYTEYAAFMNLTIQFTDRFDIQVGGRKSHDKEVLSEVDTGVLFGGAPFILPPLNVVDTPFTYLVTPRLKISPDLMIYARLASGYRAGGVNLNANLNAATGATVPTDFGADKTRNYEIGVKGNVLNHTLSFDASLYYIDWKDIQLAYISPTGVAYTTNGSPAKTQGIEFSIESHPLTGLAIATWVDWNDAKLTEDLPAASAERAMSGDRLPTSSRFSGNFSVDREFRISRSTTGFVGASVSYVGDRKGDFRPAPPRQDYPAYAQVDARAGLKFDSWTGNFFITNIADRRGVLGGGLDNINQAAFDLIRPRTVGVSFTKTF